MAARKINPYLKLGLELGPILVFFAGFMKLKGQSFQVFGSNYDGFIVMTALFIPLLLVTTGILWALTGKLSKMQMATVVMVLVFGGLSVWLKDERFFKMKPTMIYLIFAGVLGFGLLRGKSYLRGVMDEALPMQSEGWMVLTKRITAFFLGLAIANEVIWRNFSTGTWVGFKTFGLTAALFLFFMTQGRLLAKYGIPKEDGKDQD